MQYAQDVSKGRILVGKHVLLAVKRHLRDLRTAKKRGLVFDAEAAQYAIDFFQLLKHSKGEWAGQTIQLGLWQQFILWVLFGWKRADGTRRFRVGYTEVARKDGKSTIAAGIGLYLLVADGEPGAEVYTAATKAGSGTHRPWRGGSDGPGGRGTPAENWDRQGQFARPSDQLEV